MNIFAAMRPVFLIGYMGCGKTTLGRALSRKMGYEFIDLDIYIENRYRHSIKELFALHGEAGFRKIERKMLEEICEFDEQQRHNRISHHFCGAHSSTPFTSGSKGKTPDNSWKDRRGTETIHSRQPESPRAILLTSLHHLRLYRHRNSRRNRSHRRAPRRHTGLPCKQTRKSPIISMVIYLFNSQQDRVAIIAIQQQIFYGIAA